MTHDPSDQAAPKITCREVAEWTSAYLDEHLHEAAKVRMALHLVSCTGCRAYVGQIALLREALKFLPGPVAKFEQCDRLKQAFAARRFSE